MDRLTEIPTLADVAPITPKKVRKPRAKKSPAVIPAAPVPAAREGVRYKTALTVALGILIPLLSVCASKVAGTLFLNGHYALAAFGAAVGGAVLAVSLSHLAWAIADVTGSGPRSSWALAVALDCSLVLCELVHTSAADCGLCAVCWCVLVAVAVFSAVLNVHAFINHKAK